MNLNIDQITELEALVLIETEGNEVVHYPDGVSRIRVLNKNQIGRGSKYRTIYVTTPEEYIKENDNEKGE